MASVTEAQGRFFFFLRARRAKGANQEANHVGNQSGGADGEHEASHEGRRGSGADFCFSTGISPRIVSFCRAKLTARLFLLLLGFASQARESPGTGEDSGLQRAYTRSTEKDLLVQLRDSLNPYQKLETRIMVIQAST